MSSSENVYVIDDDPAMRDSLDFLLGSAGFSVALFESAVSFLDAKREQVSWSTGRNIARPPFASAGDLVGTSQ